MLVHSRPLFNNLDIPHWTRMQLTVLTIFRVDGLKGRKNEDTHCKHAAYTRVSLLHSNRHPAMIT